MIWSKLIPWAGYPLALLMFWFWIEGREDLAIEVEACNTRVAEGAAGRVSLALEAIQEAHQRDIDEANARTAAAEAASIESERNRQEADESAASAIAINRRLLREARANEAPTETQVCLDVDNDPRYIDGLRQGQTDP